MIPTSKNFIIYDENRNIIPLPAEYYGDAIKRYLDGTERKMSLSQSQLNQLHEGSALSDPLIVPLAKYGLIAESIYISSTKREIVLNDSVMGKKSIQRNRKSEREPIRVTFKLFASGFDDFSLKTSRYREFLNNLGVFYIADVRQPFKLYKVAINEPVEFIQPHYRVPIGECSLSLVKVDSIFAESLHTTLDIDREGVRWNDKWGYGMGLSTEREQWQYSFEPNPTAVNLDKGLFEQGSIFLSNGQNAGGNTQLGRLKNHYPVIRGQSYRLNLNETGGTVNYIRIFHYDASGNHISNEGTSNVYGNGCTSMNFVALGTSIRLLVYANGSAQVNMNGIGTVTKISLSGYSEVTHKIRFYNAGTEGIKLIQQKESAILLRALSNAPWVEIYDGETTFRLDRTLVNGSPLTLKGHQIRVNNANVLHHTNRNFLTIKKGWNEWEIRGITNFEFEIDFRFLYD